MGSALALALGSVYTPSSFHVSISCVSVSMCLPFFVLLCAPVRLCSCARVP